MDVPLPIPENSRYRITRPVWDEMVRSGVLDGVRVELIDGVMVEVAPEYAPHASTITKLSRWLVRAAPDEVLTHIQHPLRLGDVTAW